MLIKCCIPSVEMSRPKGVSLFRLVTAFPQLSPCITNLDHDDVFASANHDSLPIAITMLSRRIAAARPLTRAIVPATAALRPHFTQLRQRSTPSEVQELDDPGMNGGYINPPPEKRSNRDPYGDYWDKQERRNYGEPVHEDNDILGALSLHDYNHFSPGWAGVLLGTFVVTVLGLCVAVKQIYPDRVSVPKTYEGGLEAELGGPRAVRARAHGEEFDGKS
ncbi:NADH:ubiquinone oxidoreductase 20.1kD subunit [Dendryphion nanum]|uniref:NADH:ubiquinone oxidoreductase 20.1kD subunit n=1 Tax=Dendryphion nanum TaxID=256645 RepID=A0A9P9J260_9PLEO|nr:NADH:ubiquinone oxidoreductase 20.1kD subunit [Dendryphion nanum]